MYILLFTVINIITRTIYVVFFIVSLSANLSNNLSTCLYLQVPVSWTEIAGSKLIRSPIDIVTTSLAMARDIVCVRLCYLLGIWKLNK